MTPVGDQNFVVWYRSATVPFDVLGPVPIFTVQAGKTFVPIDIGAVSVTSSSGSDFFSGTAGFNSPTFDSFTPVPSTFTLNGVGNSYQFKDLDNINKTAPAGSNINVNITTANTTSASGYFFVYGILF